MSVKVRKNALLLEKVVHQVINTTILSTSFLIFVIQVLNKPFITVYFTNNFFKAKSKNSKQIYFSIFCINYLYLFYWY